MTDLPPLFAGPQPELRSARLRLRPFVPEDGPRVEPLLDDPEIAAGTLSIPHPYPPGASIPWIASHAEGWRAGRLATWALILGNDDMMVGAASLRLTLAHHRGELGYWVARAQWGKGIATEAVSALIAFGFDVLGLHRVDAHHFSENGASGVVMRKAGMRHEGRRRGAAFRDGIPRDLEEYAILRTDPRAQP